MTTAVMVPRRVTHSSSWRRFGWRWMQAGDAAYRFRCLRLWWLGRAHHYTIDLALVSSDITGHG